MDKISITLVDSFCRLPQWVIIRKSEVIICRICTQIYKEVIFAESYITILHDMGAVSIVVIGCSPLNLGMQAKDLHHQLEWACQRGVCLIQSKIYSIDLKTYKLIDIYSNLKQSRTAQLTFLFLINCFSYKIWKQALTNWYCWCKVSVRKLCKSLSKRLDCC